MGERAQTGGKGQGGACRARRTFATGAIAACGLPGLVLGASFLGFGSLVRETGLPLWFALANSASSWALPGQVVTVELFAAGAPVLLVLLAVALTNARLLPMTVVLLPHLRQPGTPRWQLLMAAHLVAVTSWTNAMRTVPNLEREVRLAWFVGFGWSLWAISLAATGVGWLLAGTLPHPVTLALVFLNPVYFMLLFVADLAQRAKTLALLLGAVLGPLLHRVDPDWGLLATGMVGGTLAFLIDRHLPQRWGGHG